MAQERDIENNQYQLLVESLKRKTDGAPKAELFVRAEEFTSVLQQAEKGFNREHDWGWKVKGFNITSEQGEARGVLSLSADDIPEVGNADIQVRLANGAKKVDGDKKNVLDTVSWIAEDRFSIKLKIKRQSVARAIYEQMEESKNSILGKIGALVENTLLESLGDDYQNSILGLEMIAPEGEFDKGKVRITVEKNLSEGVVRHQLGHLDTTEEKLQPSDIESRAYVEHMQFRGNMQAEILRNMDMQDLSKGSGAKVELGDAAMLFYLREALQKQIQSSLPINSEINPVLLIKSGIVDMQTGVTFDFSGNAEWVEKGILSLLDKPKSEPLIYRGNIRNSIYGNGVLVTLINNESTQHINGNDLNVADFDLSEALGDQIELAFADSRSGSLPEMTPDDLVVRFENGKTQVYAVTFDQINYKKDSTVVGVSQRIRDHMNSHYNGRLIFDDQELGRLFKGKLNSFQGTDLQTKRKIIAENEEDYQNIFAEALGEKRGKFVVNVKVTSSGKLMVSYEDKEVMRDRRRAMFDGTWKPGKTTKEVGESALYTIFGEEHLRPGEDEGDAVQKKTEGSAPEKPPEPQKILSAEEIKRLRNETPEELSLTVLASQNDDERYSDLVWQKDKRTAEDQIEFDRLLQISNIFYERYKELTGLLTGPSVSDYRSPGFLIATDISTSFRMDAKKYFVGSESDRKEIEAKWRKWYQSRSKDEELLKKLNIEKFMLTEDEFLSEFTNDKPWQTLELSQKSETYELREKRLSDLFNTYPRSYEYFSEIWQEKREEMSLTELANHYDIRLHQELVEKQLGKGEHERPQELSPTEESLLNLYNMVYGHFEDRFGDSEDGVLGKLIGVQNKQETGQIRIDLHNSLVFNALLYFGAESEVKPDLESVAKAWYRRIAESKFLIGKLKLDPPELKMTEDEFWNEFSKDKPFVSNSEVSNEEKGVLKQRHANNLPGEHPAIQDVNLESTVESGGQANSTVTSKSIETAENREVRLQKILAEVKHSSAVMNEMFLNRRGNISLSDFASQYKSEIHKDLFYKERGYGDYVGNKGVLTDTERKLLSVYNSIDNIFEFRVGKRENGIVHKLIGDIKYGEDRSVFANELVNELKGFALGYFGAEESKRGAIEKKIKKWYQTASQNKEFLDNLKIDGFRMDEHDFWLEFSKDMPWAKEVEDKQESFVKAGVETGPVKETVPSLDETKTFSKEEIYRMRKDGSADLGVLAKQFDRYRWERMRNMSLEQKKQHLDEWQRLSEIRTTFEQRFGFAESVGSDKKLRIGLLKQIFGDPGRGKEIIKAQDNFILFALEQYSKGDIKKNVVIQKLKQISENPKLSDIIPQLSWDETFDEFVKIQPWRVLPGQETETLSQEAEKAGGSKGGGMENTHEQYQDGTINLAELSREFSWTDFNEYRKRGMNSLSGPEQDRYLKLREIYTIFNVRYGFGEDEVQKRKGLLLQNYGKHLLNDAEESLISDFIIKTAMEYFGNPNTFEDSDIGNFFKGIHGNNPKLSTSKSRLSTNVLIAEFKKITPWLSKSEETDLKNSSVMVATTSLVEELPVVVQAEASLEETKPEQTATLTANKIKEMRGTGEVDLRTLALQFDQKTWDKLKNKNQKTKRKYGDKWLVLSEIHKTFRERFGFSEVTIEGEESPREGLLKKIYGIKEPTEKQKQVERELITFAIEQLARVEGMDEDSVKEKLKSITSNEDGAFETRIVLKDEVLQNLVSLFKNPTPWKKEGDKSEASANSLKVNKAEDPKPVTEETTGVNVENVSKSEESDDRMNELMQGASYEEIKKVWGDSERRKNLDLSALASQFDISMADELGLRRGPLNEKESELLDRYRIIMEIFETTCGSRPGTHMYETFGPPPEDKELSELWVRKRSELARFMIRFMSGKEEREVVTDEMQKWKVQTKSQLGIN